MTIQYPKPDGAFTFLVEDVRPEQGNKATMLGVMFGTDITLPNAQPGGVIPSLAFVTAFRDGLGTFGCRFKLTSPSGMILVDKQHTPITISPTNAAVVVSMFKPFAVPEFGRYKYELYLDTQVYEYTCDLHS
jgi:hypothetical protein